MKPSEPLPRETVRDLLGIVRALYAEAKDRGAEPIKLEELKQIGNELREALDLAQTEPGTLGHRAAWAHAEHATERLGRVIDSFTTVLPAIAAMKRRLTGVVGSPRRR